MPVDKLRKMFFPALVCMSHNIIIISKRKLGTYEFEPDIAVFDLVIIGDLPLT